jgi:hypothetical protein
MVHESICFKFIYLLVEFVHALVCFTAYSSAIRIGSIAAHNLQNDLING